MDDATQSEIRELDALLMRAAASGISGTRGFESQTGQDALAFIADCIATCIMPRRLLISLSGGLRCTLLASNGRLIDMIECDEDADVDAQEDPTADAVCIRLLDLFDKPGQLSVHIRMTEVDPSVMLAGIPASELTAAVGLAPVSSLQEEPVEIFREGILDLLLATISENGDVEILSDDFTVTAELTAAALTYMTGKNAPTGPDDLLVFRPIAFPHLCLAVHSGKTGRTGFILTRDTAELVAEFWASLSNLMVAVEF